jgi:hypothetical protein
MNKILILISILTIPISVLATEIKIASERLTYEEVLVDAKFSVNANAGRAWVEYEVYGDDGEDDWYTDKRVKVEGLVFDKNTSSIIITNGAEEIVCATTSTRSRRIFRGSVRIIKSTGACLFKVRKERIAVDDGYRVVMKKVDSLYLILK